MGLKEALQWAETQGWEPELLKPLPASATSSQYVTGQAPSPLGRRFTLTFQGLLAADASYRYCVWRHDCCWGDGCGETKARRKKPPGEVFLSFLDFLGSIEVQIPAESTCGHWPSIFGLATFESRWMVPSLAVSRQRLN